MKTDTTTQQTCTDFEPIDGANTGLPTFVVSMLKVGQIKLAKEFEIREVTATKINRWMQQNRNHIPSIYTPKQIREQLFAFGGEISGGGVKIEWSELPEEHYGSIPQYHFTFSRIIEPNESEPTTL